MLHLTTFSTPSTRGTLLSRCFYWRSSAHTLCCSSPLLTLVKFNDEAMVDCSVSLTLGKISDGECTASSREVRVASEH
jgi:hypothetical protein